ncbi:MAG: hypothetical protein KIS95_10095 [Anaerolineae bacterium]|nr:hypothetical protein [Anaerolineales bacterium]MCB8935877.1 hypothetical protein [Promineifilum sp.]MCW5847571.1 hypothetical protein [Anaerolineae bacterium]
MGRLFAGTSLEAEDKPIEKLCLASPQRGLAMAGAFYGTGRFTPDIDVVLAKLDGYRLGGRVSIGRWQELPGVRVAQRDKQECAYMRENAGVMSLGDRLEKAFSEGGNT